MNKQTILLDKVLKLFEQISQLQMLFNDVMDIMNYQDINKEVSELLIKHAENGQNTINLYDKVEELLYDLFKRDEIENLPPSPGQEDFQQTERFGKNPLEDGISLKPDFSWKQTFQKTPIMDNIINEHPLVIEYNCLIRELYALQNTETYYMDFTGIYPRINCVQGYDCNFVQK